MSFYSNDGYGRGGFMSNTPVAVKNIIIVNIVMLVVTMLNRPLMYEKFALWFPASPFFEWWQPVTHMFMHSGFFHLFFNMYALYVFGSVLERVWGPKKFLLFYFVTGLGAALVHTGVQWIEYQSALDMLQSALQPAESYIMAVRNIIFVPTVGASGAVYGVLLGFAMLYPDTILRLWFPPIALKAKWLVIIFGAIEIVLGITSTGAGIAHFAHLGGLIFGFILLMYWKKTRNLYGSY